VKQKPEAPEVLTPAEVAQLWKVDPKTVHRWERDGLFPEGAVFRTPGGHRRYKGDAIRALLDGGEQR
jgi:DNA-binding transcriptional MerR regulator